MSKSVHIIIPAYNAEQTLEQVFERFPAEVDRQIDRYIAVDDGSTDGTREVLDALSERYKKLQVLSHDGNRGYGAAEKTLLTHSIGQGADLMLLVHADGQYSPESIPEILGQFREGGADVVQGSRMLGGGALKGGMPKYKYAANKILTWLENKSFGMQLAEFHSGYMCYRRSFVEKVPFQALSDSFDFDLEMLVMARLLNARIHEVAIPTIYADEVSHLNPVQYGLDVLGVIRKYRRGTYRRLLESA